jgi:hypothetical protein
MVNRFQKIERLSNRRLWISSTVKGSLSAWRPSFQKDGTCTAQVFCRKRHAKELGLTVPLTLQVVADRVIE